MGAWIETLYCAKYATKQVVAPYVGAWIETGMLAIHKSPVGASHPTWVRGLKQGLCHEALCLLPVAPYVGAWIETQELT